MCAASKRFIVEASIADAFTENSWPPRSS
ncbi:hypothetical protein CSE899_19349 [Cronobacter sakazakii E899]|nr:hypothetical protein CSE899_19349 [Cronobacter sakazakii E899]